MIGNVGGLEWAILLVVALIVVGPERLPQYVQQAARVVRELKKMADGASSRVKEELGEEFEDLRALDPRQYDPRRIVRDALTEDFDVPGVTSQLFGGGSGSVPGPRRSPAVAGAGAGAVGARTPASEAVAPISYPPYDDEAT